MINYFIVNIVLPPLIIGVNLGFWLFELFPDIFPLLLGIIGGFFLISFLFEFWRETRASEKI